MHLIYQVILMHCQRHPNHNQLSEVAQKEGQ